jgi:beta-galactosidase beta subunit
MDRYIDKIINTSKYKAIAFKNENKKLYECILNFCSKNNVLLLNKNVNMIELDDKKLKNKEMEDLDEDFSFHIFTTEPQEISKRLSEEIYNTYSTYITIHIYLRGSENIISIDNNKVVYVYKYASKEIKKDINSIECVVLNKKLQFLDSLTLLFFMSRDLYHPSVFLDICRKKDNKIFNSFCKILLNSYKKIESDENSKHKFLESIIQGAGSRNKFNKNNLFEIKKFIKKYLIECVKGGDDIILLGIDNYENIISSKSFPLIKDLKLKIEKKYKQQFRYIMSDFFVFNDFRFKRITLITQSGERLLSIFNNLEYEAVPVIKKESDIKIAHPIVNIRYELFNLMTNIHYSKEIKKYTIKTSIEKCIENLKTAYDRNNENIEYIGKYKDDRIEKFKIGSSAWRPKNKII